MSDIFDISQMTEEDIKLQYITPALLAKWDIKKITMETAPVNNFTDGKVHIKGNIPSRDKGIKMSLSIKASNLYKHFL